MMRKEVDDCYSRFAIYDENRNGRINFSQLTKAMHECVGPTMSEDLIKRYTSAHWQSVGGAPDATLDFRPFLELYAKIKYGR